MILSSSRLVQCTINCYNHDITDYLCTVVPPSIPVDKVNDCGMVNKVNPFSFLF